MLVRENTSNGVSSLYLVTGGVRIWISPPSGTPPFEIEPGACVALTGTQIIKKRFFCDWIMGIRDWPDHSVLFETSQGLYFEAGERRKISGILGTNPIVHSKTLHESILFGTTGVEKNQLYTLIDQLFGPTLRAKTNPKNPLFDSQGKPILTCNLSPVELLEIAQINLILQKVSVVILDMNSPSIQEALNLGFRFAPPLFESGKTILVLTEQQNSFENCLGRPFTTSIQF